MRRIEKGARSLPALFGVVVGINFIWEMAQMPLYENMPFAALSSWWLCFRASIGDGVIVLVIWALGATLLRRADSDRRRLPHSSSQVNESLFYDRNKLFVEDRVEILTPRRKRKRLYNNRGPNGSRPRAAEH